MTDSTPLRGEKQHDDPVGHDGMECDEGCDACYFCRQWVDARAEAATLRAQNKRLQEAYGMRCVLAHEREDALMAEAATLREALAECIELREAQEPWLDVARAALAGPTAQEPA
jgi:hypothetical protein